MCLYGTIPIAPFRQRGVQVTARIDDPILTIDIHFDRQLVIVGMTSIAILSNGPAS